MWGQPPSAVQPGKARQPLSEGMDSKTDARSQHRRRPAQKRIHHFHSIEFLPIL